MTLQNLSVTRKLTLAFGALAVIVLLMAAVSLSALGAEHGTFSTYVKESAARLKLAGVVLDAANARAISARNLVLVTSPADRDSEKAKVGAAHAKVTASLAALKDTLTKSGHASDQEHKLFADLERVEQAYGPLALAIVDLALNDKRAEAIQRMNVECRPLLAQLVAAAEAYAHHGADIAARQVAHGDETYAANRVLMVAAVVVALGLTIGLTLLITRAITVPIRQAVQVAQTVAAGDLTSTIRVTSTDETGALLSALKSMNDSLIHIVERVRQSSESIATGSAEIASGSLDLSSRTEAQAASLEQTAASMEQMTATVKSSADIARQASQLASSASQAAEHGGRMVDQVVSTMGEISDSSKRIADITSVIDGIAFQTNILALNAAVEAARAGEQGRGFAVVAGEVRTLAQRSADAAREIKSLIGASVERVAAGSRVVAEAGSTMGDIVAQVKRVADLISEISASSAEQTSGIGQVNDAVTQLDRGTQQNAALVEESSAAAESLKQQASRLSEVVGEFRLAA